MENKKNKLSEIGKRNVVAEGSIMHYKNILSVLQDIHEKNKFVHEKTRVFEDETEALFQFFDNIQENSGLPDWFKYFCEGQCEIVAD